MKQFLQNTLWFGLFVLALCLIIEFLLYLRPNTYSYKHDYLEEHVDDIQVLILGNSHIEEAIIPSELGKGVFNSAIAGRRLRYDIELGKMYIPKMSHLKYVLMPLDYTAFSFGRMGSPDDKGIPSPMDRTYQCMYYKYMNIRLDGIQYWSEIMNSKIKFMARFFESDSVSRGCDSLGFVSMKYSNRTSDWKTRTVPDSINTNISPDKKLQESLYENYAVLASLCKEKGVRLVLISTPMYETYREAMNPEVRKEMVSFTQKLKTEFGVVDYYDFTDDVDFKDEDFLDASHLTHAGALKLSAKLRKLI
jgi:hypothetical protein